MVSAGESAKVIEGGSGRGFGAPGAGRRPQPHRETDGRHDVLWTQSPDGLLEAASWMRPSCSKASSMPRRRKLKATTRAACANKQSIFFLPFVAVHAEAYAAAQIVELGGRGPCAISACRRRA